MQAVAFSDFLLADILTSLAKPLSDLGVSACHLLQHPALAPMLRNSEAFDAGAGNVVVLCGNQQRDQRQHRATHVKERDLTISC